MKNATCLSLQFCSRNHGSFGLKVRVLYGIQQGRLTNTFMAAVDATRLSD